MTDPNVAILTNAWNLLWRATSPYYLPTVLANGGTFGGTHIPSMSNVTVPDIGSIPLFTSDTWGNVSIKLTSAQVSGLPGVQPVSFTPSSDARSVSATVKFTDLKFSGSYEVDGTGVAGCAMDIAQSQAYNVPVVGESLMELGDPPPPANMTLARGYRDQLVQSANGTTLVGKYYDHNDTVNLILSRQNAFTKQWPHGVTPQSHNTAYYIQLTAAAATNPDNPDYTVGGNDTGYLFHGAYMQALLIGTCNYYITNDPERAGAYEALRDDAATFKGYTSTYPNPMTVDTVMSAVTNATAMSPEDLAAAPEPDAVREGRLAGERDWPELQRIALAEEAAQVQQAVTYKSTGDFAFEFTMPTLTFSGAVAISGIPPNQTLTATLTSLSAAIPNMEIDLLTSTDPTFAADAQQQIDGSPWFQKVLGKSVNGQLGSTQVLGYLSNMINQAIASIIGG